MLWWTQITLKTLSVDYIFIIMNCGEIDLLLNIYDMDILNNKWIRQLLKHEGKLIIYNL